MKNSGTYTLRVVSPALEDKLNREDQIPTNDLDDYVFLYADGSLPNQLVRVKLLGEFSFLEPAFAGLILTPLLSSL